MHIYDLKSDHNLIQINILFMICVIQYQLNLNLITCNYTCLHFFTALSYSQQPHNDQRQSMTCVWSYTREQLSLTSSYNRHNTKNDNYNNFLQLSIYLLSTYYLVDILQSSKRFLQTFCHQTFKKSDFDIAKFIYNSINIRNKRLTVKTF